MSIDKNQPRSKILLRDRAKAWRGEMLLLSLWIFKVLTWLPMLSNAYRSLLIHLIKRTELFDRTFYLETHGDAVHSGMSPLRHYVTHGDREGRSPMAFFDPDYYRSRTEGRTVNVNTLLHYAHVGRYRRISPSPWFDVDYYLALNKDVARAGFDPLRHYLRWGGVEGRSPSPEFDGSYYLRTNPSVTQSRLNPLLHYLQIGRFEGRSTVPDEKHSDFNALPDDVIQASMPSEASWTELKPRAGTKRAAVDVVVPVYQGRAETLRCLYSVLAASCTTSFELVVIDDAGPDAELNEDLERLSSRGLFTLMSNPQNLGFVHTVNRGMALHPKRDVVLLNADTEVFDGWLDRLRLTALRHPRTATVTPLSNNATICSYPRFLQDNPFPLELSYAELDALTATVNAGVAVEAPTGIGFCLYIKRAVLKEVGPIRPGVVRQGLRRRKRLLPARHPQGLAQHALPPMSSSTIGDRPLSGGKKPSGCKQRLKHSTGCIPTTIGTWRPSSNTTRCLTPAAASTARGCCGSAERKTFSLSPTIAAAAPKGIFRKTFGVSAGRATAYT